MSGYMPSYRPWVAVHPVCPYDQQVLPFPSVPIAGHSTQDRRAEYRLECSCGWVGFSPKFIPLPEPMCPPASE